MTEPRQASWVPVAAAVAIVVVVVAVVLLLSRGGDTNTAGELTTASGALACPHAYRTGGTDRGLWVPAKPAGIDGSKRMTPDLQPEHVVVCAYLHGGALTAQQVPLTGHRELRGDLGAAAGNVSQLPRGSAGQRPCPAYATATDSDDYLIGFTYAAGTVWVSAPGNHCAGSSNGTFSSPTNLRAYAAAAYGKGSWVSDP